MWHRTSILHSEIENVIELLDLLLTVLFRKMCSSRQEREREREREGKKVA